MSVGVIDELVHAELSRLVALEECDGSIKMGAAFLTALVHEELTSTRASARRGKDGRRRRRGSETF